MFSFSVGNSNLMHMLMVILKDFCSPQPVRIGWLNKNPWQFGSSLQVLMLFIKKQPFFSGGWQLINHRILKGLGVQEK